MKTRNIILSIAIFIIFLLAILTIVLYPRLVVAPTEVNRDENIVNENTQEEKENNNENTSLSTIPQVYAKDLSVPWEMIFLPDGDLLVTEREGNLVRIGKQEHKIKVEGVEPTSEGGLLGLALHPQFSENNWIYLYITTKTNNEITNKVVRYEYINSTLQNVKVIIDKIPGSSNHDGGRIKFGPDSKLYVTVGDATNQNGAQSLEFLGGKILRLNDDGTIPSDNPLPNSPVYSYGHRNPQGIAWDSKGQLWSNEHGRSGVGTSGFDEVNLITAGGNYGWPDIEGDKTKSGMINPKIHSGATTTWAPAGLTIYKDYAIYTGLRGESIYVLNLNTLELKTKYTKEYGRLRAITLGNDGYIYFGSSNKDGRGIPLPSDDRIYRVSADSLIK